MMKVEQPKSKSQIGRMAKRKGNTAERFVKDYLLEELGITARYTREQQAVVGGFDLLVNKIDNIQGTLGLDRCAIEVRNREDQLLDAWWQEAIKNTTIMYPSPILFFKLGRRKGWKVRMGLNYFLSIHSYRDHYMDISLTTFSYLVREKCLEIKI